MPVEQVVGVGAELDRCQKGGVGGRQVGQLHVSSAEAFGEAVFECFFHELFVLRGEIVSEHFGRVDGVVVQPGLCGLEVDDVSSQLMQDELHVPQVQLCVDALLWVDPYRAQGLQHLLHFLLGLRHTR